MSDYVARQGTTALGIIGTALGGLATVGNGLNLFGGNQQEYLSKTEAELMHANAAKDSEIALLKANAVTDAKLVEVYTAAADRDKAIRSEINDEFKAVRAEMRLMENNQTAINSAQAVNNATTASTLAVLSSNQQNLQAIIGGLTKTVIPNSNVCPGWGAVTMVPTCSNTGTTIG